MKIERKDEKSLWVYVVGRLGSLATGIDFLAQLVQFSSKLACESARFVRYDYIYWNIFGLIHGIYEGPVIRRLQV